MIFKNCFGDITWVRTYLDRPTVVLKPLFDILHGDPNPRSPRKLTPKAKASLTLLKEGLNSKRLLRIDYNKPWSILPTDFTPTACLWQGGPLECLPFTCSS